MPWHRFAHSAHFAHFALFIAIARSATACSSSDAPPVEEQEAGARDALDDGREAAMGDTPDATDTTDTTDATDVLDGGNDGGATVTRPYLILHAGFANTIPTPDFVVKNADIIDGLPFDGLFVNLGAVTSAVMNEKALSYSALATALAPLKTTKLKKATQNFALVLSDRPADFFDDWTTPTQNFGNLARAANDAGLVGVAFDNEQYLRMWGRYPDDVKYASTKTLADYQLQVAARGTEIMAAMIKEFPAIVVLTFHGPYISEPKSPSPPLPSVAAFNNLLGPLFVGFVEAAKGTSARVVDGGELYGLRTKAEFLAAYQFRKIDIASKIDCAFIPTTLRPSWPVTVDVGYGLYDRENSAPFPLLDVSVVHANVTNALRQSDEWVWFYTEKIDFLKPSSAGGAPAVWVDAVQKGKDDGLSGWKPPWP